MERNLFIAYDLLDPGQNYPAVTAAIEGLGKWAKLQLSLYYVRTVVEPAVAYNTIRSYMDLNDKLAVIVALDAWVGSYGQSAMDILRQVFNTPQMGIPYFGDWRP